MLLEGSCHCAAVSFQVSSQAPFPYRSCFCARCRKTAGGTGAAANLLADADSLVVSGSERLNVYAAPDGTRTRFCSVCGSALFLTIDGWERFVYPFASAIDTPLPEPPERVHVFVGEAPAWVARPSPAAEFDRNTRESVEAWHRRLDLLDPE